MPYFEVKSAQLDECDGKGYLFENNNDQIQGVFYSNPDKFDLSEELPNEGPIVFQGALYKTNRSGKVTQTAVEVEVEVSNILKVALGERALIIVN